MKRSWSELRVTYYEKTPHPCVFIPSEVTTCPNCRGNENLTSITFALNSSVKCMVKEAFCDCKSLQWVNIPASVEEIGERCFMNCSSLFNITFASGSVLKRIGKNAFKGCPSLREIKIPASVEELDDGCFDSSSNFAIFSDMASSSLSSVTFSSESRLKRIGKNVFLGCTSLDEIEIPSSVEMIDASCFLGSCISRITFASDSRLKRIGVYAFGNGEYLDEIEIPAGVEEICNSLFHSCSLSCVRFANGSILKSIGNGAFSKSSIREIQIPASVEEIGEGCFHGSCVSCITFASASRLKRIGEEAFIKCRYLKDIEIPASVEEIGEKCFTRSFLSRITFANGSCLKRIGAMAFSECANLREIEIPGSVEEIGARAFANCGIEKITVEENQWYQLVGGCLLQTDSKTLVFCFSNISEIEIPSYVEVIGEECFKYKAVSRVTFSPGSRLKRIEVHAFYGCSNLAEIEIPGEVEEIGVQSFARCDIPNFRIAEENQWYRVVNHCILRVDSKTLVCCFRNISEIEIPEYVEIIGEKCFCAEPESSSRTERWSALSNVVFESGSCLKKIGSRAFSGCSIGALEIPSGVATLGLALSGIDLGRLTFASGTRLKHLKGSDLIMGSEIVIPASVEAIERGVCREACEPFSISFERGSRLKKLGHKVFCDRPLTGDLVLPATVEYIGNGCFENTRITSVKFEPGSRLREIGTGAFYETNIREVEIPASVEIIRESAFNETIQRVTFENGSRLKHVCEMAFPLEINIQFPKGAKVDRPDIYDLWDEDDDELIF